MSPRRHLDLPLLPTALIGRDDEAAEALRLLAAGRRMVTFTGPPGVGKTSLALSVAHEVADDFRYGARSIDLAAVDDPTLVAAAIAEGLGMRRPGEHLLLEHVVQFVRDRRLLLVLDNFEQVVEAAPQVADLLARCPNLTVLVTSRVPLRIRWESELTVGPLTLPDPEQLARPATLHDVASIALFVARARGINPRFQLSDEHARLVGEICIALDGLPLAIELAAARVRTLSVAAMHDSLVGGRALTVRGQRPVAPLVLLAGGARDLPDRHQSVRNAVAWSYDRLTPAEQVLLRRLAVFAGGCTFEAAATVCEGSWEAITTLVEHSLVRHEEPTARARNSDDEVAESRVRLLETVRQFGLEQLEARGEDAALRRRHAAFFLDLAEQAEPELAGPAQAVWLDRLGQDHANLRAAARWVTAAGDVESVVRLGAALLRFWRARGEAVDIREHLEAILALASAAPAMPATVKALYGASDLAMLVGDFPVAQSLLEQSLRIARQLDDRAGTAMALSALCKLTAHRGDYAEARRLGEESVEILTAHGPQEGLAGALYELGMVCYFADDLAEAQGLFERSRTLALQLGDLRLVSRAAYGRALTHHLAREYTVAWGLYQECLAIDREQGHRSSEGSDLNHLGHLAILRGDFEQARMLLADSLLASRDGGDRRRLGFTLSAVAGLAVNLGDPQQALRLDAAGRAAVDAMGARLAPAVRALYDEQLAPAYLKLGEDGVGQAQVAGRRLLLDDAVDEALGWLTGSEVAGVPESELPGPTTPEPIGVSVMQPAADADVTPCPAVLTRREREVAVLLGRGLTTNREIASALVITEGTAASYVQRVLTRLDLHTRAQIAAWAASHGLDEAEPSAR